MRNSLLISVSVLILSTFPQASSFAGEAEDTIIAKVVEAYGGEALTSAKSLTFTSRLRLGIPGQGYTPGFVDMDTEEQIFTVAPDKQIGLTENWSNHRGAVFHNATLITKDAGYNINYREGSFTPQDDPNYHTSFGGFIRGHDTLLAYELNARAATATYQGEVNYHGRPHAEISIEFPASPDLHIFVDQDTGLISKMSRTIGDNEVNYLFDSYATSDGVTYAQDYIFYNQGLPMIIIQDRMLSVNKARQKDFTLSKSLSQAPAQYAPPEGMYIKGLSDTLHYVGQNGAHSVFMEVSDHILAVGGYGGFAERFEAYKTETQTEKPLKYLVATHHHQDHIQGVSEAYELGATIMVPPVAREAIKEDIGEDVEDARIVDITQDQEMGEMLFHLAPSTHAAQNVFVYFPALKAVLSADHYGNNAAEGASPAFYNAVSLHKILSGLDWDIETLLDIHAPKPTAWENFKKVIADYDPSLCPSNRKICGDKE